MRLKTTIQGLFFIIIPIIIGFFIIFQCMFRPACRYSIQGIDVSKWNDIIDWEAVTKTNTQFVFMKATEGKNLKDKRFKSNWQALDSTKLLKGAYHFYRPKVLAKQQAKNFIQAVQLKSGDLPPVLDLEVTDGRSKKIILRGVKTWLSTIEQHYDVKPIIYVNRSFYYDYIEGNFDDYPIWIAAYTWRRPKIKRIDWQFWQYSETGSKLGIKGDVDLNVFRGSEEKLRNLCIP